MINNNTKLSLKSEATCMSGAVDSSGELNGGITPLNIILPVYDVENSITPFVHALKFALASRGELEIVDVRSADAGYLGVRSQLEKWGILPASSKRADVVDVGLKIKKIVKEGNQRKEILKRLNRHYHDLMVVGTGAQNGFKTFFGRDLGELLTDNFKHTTLLFPYGARSFIEENSGKVRLNNVLVYLKNSRAVSSANRSVKMLTSMFPEVKLQVIALYAGASFPDFGEEFQSLNWTKMCRNEAMIPAIIHCTEEYQCDVIILILDKKETVAKKVGESSIGQVLHKCGCPVLIVYE